MSRDLPDTVAVGPADSWRDAVYQLSLRTGVPFLATCAPYRVYLRTGDGGVRVHPLVGAGG